MFPGGINPRQMKQMMKRMGIKTNEISAEMVVIHSGDKKIIIEDPQVVKMTMHGQEIFNITGGTVREEKGEEEVILEISEDDVNMVSEQAQVSEEEARKALEETNGDIAEAIMKLKG
ncbi:MAG: nascent polypeptide-associated complex protein [Candidatus Altiarchaeales archaeon]|uniref:Nascent polypeptide-associated complex protein n=1 Tax=candidate division WOR-3 bacterium TaxID=2052148 RepID=A0A7C5DCT3_UNCW3|nr:MAG: nascent polypeptide-associated complex protein [Candidatus Altiarchaeales archaeon]HHE04500.1 nascent polypeptide-associated complex protein [candidate division WOR-3 bacterium]